MSYSNSTTKIKVQFDKGDYKKMNDMLNTVDWQKQYEKYNDGVEKQWAHFKNNIWK